jgi:uncharacterized iron-regulated membrane protein
MVNFLIDGKPMTMQRSAGVRPALMALLMRLHFYIGLFIGPFIFLAALSGTLYVLTPQIENQLYAKLLYPESKGVQQSLEQQVLAAHQAIGFQTLQLTAVRPASGPGHSTRVMFADPTLKSGENRALFIDPVTLAVLGEQTVYGTSGILPLRIWIDYLHSGALFGDFGRYYSELAATWLWVAALGGVVLWVMRKPTRKKSLRGRHAVLGLILLPLLLLFSATGLTWSQWAGDNINVVRQMLDWRTPPLNSTLSDTPTAADEHAHHHGDHSGHNMMRNPDPRMYDWMLLQARRHGINADKVEIRPPASPDRAWTVSEIDRSWPTQVDAVAINPENMQVVDKVEFTQYPLVAKLIRWGIDAHMGILFGLINQLALAAFGIGLCVMIVWGYMMWWRRRPKHQPAKQSSPTLLALWRLLPWYTKLALILPTILLIAFLPLMGFGLVAFILIDVINQRYSLKNN